MNNQQQEPLSKWLRHADDAVGKQVTQITK